MQKLLNLEDLLCNYWTLKFWNSPFQNIGDRLEKKRRKKKNFIYGLERSKSKRLEGFRGQNHQESSFWRYDFISRTHESEILVVGIDTTRKFVRYDVWGFDF